jgi:hypothetical protein
LSDLTKDADDYRPEKDTNKELCNYSGCLQGKSVHKETISMDNYKTNTRVTKHTCKKHDSAINSNYRNQQAHTKDSTHTIPVLINGITSIFAINLKVVFNKIKNIKLQSSVTVMLKTLQVM